MTNRAPAIQEFRMSQPPSVASQEQVIDTMIELTRLSTQHRTILAGSDSLELYLALRRRGFNRVATTATCRIPKGQHAVGLITGQNSLQAIEAALTKISQFLSASAAVAVLTASWNRWVFGSRPVSGARRAWCCQPTGRASARWKTQLEIR